MDNRYEEDTFANPHKTPIPVAIHAPCSKTRASRSTSSATRLSARRPNGAQPQFRVIEELPIPGKFYEVNDAATLAGVLDKAMGRRLRYWVEEEDNVLVSGTPGEGLTTSRVGANDRWFAPALAPGGFKLVIDPLRRQTRNIALNNGDLLDPVGPRAGRGRFPTDRVLSRGLLLEARDREEPLVTWRSSRTNSGRLRPADALHAGGAVSRFEEPRGRPARPVWYELEPLARFPTPRSPCGGATGPAIRRGLDPGRSRSAEQARGPLPRRGRSFDAGGTRSTHPASGGLDRGPDFNLDTGRAADPVPIEGAMCRRGVRVEDHRVETGRCLGVKSCLVVRLGHSPGNRSGCVRLAWFPPAPSIGSTRRGQTTALFWPVTRDEAACELTGLSLYSIKTFKAQADAAGSRSR